MVNMDKGLQWPYYLKEGRHLTPIGKHFSQSDASIDDEEQWIPVSVDKSRKIQKARCSFLRKCGMLSRNEQDNYEKLGLKTCFILENTNRINRIDTVEELLADQSTLFSRAFMRYKYAKDIFDVSLGEAAGLKIRMELAEFFRSNYYRDYKIPGIQLTEYTLESVLKQLRNHASQSRRDLTFYPEKLNRLMEVTDEDESQITEKILRQLKRWGIETKIEKNQVNCLKDCIDIYCSSITEYRASSCGTIDHFSPVNNRGEYKEFKDYQHRKKVLKEMREKCVQ